LYFKETFLPLVVHVASSGGKGTVATLLFTSLLTSDGREKTLFPVDGGDDGGGFKGAAV
jgi:hypothetical protein